MHPSEHSAKASAHSGRGCIVAVTIFIPADQNATFYGVVMRSAL
jgi:hypothetical protein